MCSCHSKVLLQGCPEHRAGHAQERRTQPTALWGSSTSTCRCCMERVVNVRSDVFSWRSRRLRTTSRYSRGTPIWICTATCVIGGLYDLLARSPRDFERSSKIRPIQPTVRRQPYTMTNKRLETTSVILVSRLDPRLYYLPLNCFNGTRPCPLAVPLLLHHDNIYM